MNTTSLLILALRLGALGSGLMAGVYFAFSVFIMPAFRQLDLREGLPAMKAINEVILVSGFMPVFFGSTAIAVTLAVLGSLKQGEANGWWAVVAGLVYLVGMFLCTAAMNVPLNESLVGVDPTTSEAVQRWARYLDEWTWWNHVRTVASLVSAAICVWLLRR